MFYIFDVQQNFVFEQIRVEDVTEEFCHGTNGHWQFSDNNFQSVWYSIETLSTKFIQKLTKIIVCIIFNYFFVYLFQACKV